MPECVIIIITDSKNPNSRQYKELTILMSDNKISKIKLKRKIQFNKQSQSQNTICPFEVATSL